MGDPSRKCATETTMAPCPPVNAAPMRLAGMEYVADAPDAAEVTAT